MSGQDNVLLSVSEGDVVANGDIAKFFENSTIEVPVLNNDFGLVSGVKSVRVVSGPEHGECVVLPNNNIAFTPQRNFVGTDKFEYEVCANEGGCDIGFVSVEVMDYDFKPKAVNDTVTLTNSRGYSPVFNILKNDIDVFDEPITVSIISSLTDGSVQVNDDQTVTPKFGKYFVGLDSVSYMICDAEEDCDTAWIFFDARPENQGMFVPTGISPNGDGLNDFFYVHDLAIYENLRIKIFSQLGYLVYDDPAYKNHWDGMANVGTYKGNLLPTGTYYYLLTVDKTEIKINGYIYISR